LPFPQFKANIDGILHNADEAIVYAIPNHVSPTHSSGGVGSIGCIPGGGKGYDQKSGGTESSSDSSFEWQELLCSSGSPPSRTKSDLRRGV
jgi:hypothetical protein